MRSHHALTHTLIGAAAGCSDATPASPAAPPAATAPPVTPPPVVAPPTTTPTTPRDNTTPGSATPVDPGSANGSTPGATPLSDPAMNDGRIGRAARRLNVRQLRASLLNAVGVTWQQPRRILSADYASGFYDAPNADMLSLVALTLGQPDYNAFTSESIEPGAVFSKLVGDAARKACRDGVTLDVARPVGERILLRTVGVADTLATREAAVRDNLAYLVMRFWARDVRPNDPVLDDLIELFRVASTAPATAAPVAAAGTPVDGWRAVCVALTTDPLFLTY